jgi:hypothetical protein
MPPSASPALASATATANSSAFSGLNVMDFCLLDSAVMPPKRHW